jgi:undecaprenyl-diphosphatase
MKLYAAVMGLLSKASRLEWLTLASIVTTLGALTLFAKVTEDVLAGESRAFDTMLLLALRTPGNPADPLGPPWFEDMMRDFTAMGSTGVLSLMIVIVVGFLLIIRKRQAAIMVLFSTLSGVILSTILKIGFNRPRPELVPHATPVHTASFPSGHAMLSAVVYLTLGVLLARTQSAPRVKAYIILVSLTLTLLVGISRVYLGVHWPTDVIAGWSLGSAWALLCWLAMLYLQDRKYIESDQAQPGRS